MPRVMLLIPTRSYRAPDFMEAAERLGVEVVVGSDERHPLEDLERVPVRAAVLVDRHGGEV